MKLGEVFSIIAVFISIFFLALSSAETTNTSLYSESNVITGNLLLSGSTNADSSTTENWASVTSNKWASDKDSWIFNFENPNSQGDLDSVQLYLKHYQTGHINDNFNLDIYNGTSWTTIKSYGTTSTPPTSDTINIWDVSSILDSYSKINSSQFRIIGNGKNNGDDTITWYIDTIELKVNSIIESCISNLFNLTIRDWTNESCLKTDFMNQSKEILEYDQNFCEDSTNKTYIEYRDDADSCNYCSYSTTFTNWTNWQTIGECLSNNTALQQRNRTEYDENFALCYLVTTIPGDLWNDGENITETQENYDAICDYCSTISPIWQWDNSSSWNNETCLNTDFWYQIRNVTRYDLNGCEINQTFLQERNDTEFCNYACEVLGTSWSNISWNEWYNSSETCEDNEMLQFRNGTSYDLNGCNETILDYIENRTIECGEVVCNTNWSDISWNSWINQQCVDSQMNQTINGTSYDLNGCNDTILYYFNETLVGPDYNNISIGSEWENITICQENDTQVWKKLINISIDSYGCAENLSYYQYNEIECDFCTPSLTNSSWSEWQNESCSFGQMNQSQYLIEYDENFCGEGENHTYFNFTLVGPIYQNTSETEWVNISECLPTNLTLQQKNITSTDSYNCAPSQLYTEYRNISCSYVLEINETTNETETPIISIVNNTENITINESAGEIKIIIPSTINQMTQKILNFTSSTSNNTLNISQKVTLKRETTKTNYTIEIPANTTINGNSNWTGLIILPTFSEITLSGKYLNSSVKVGDENQLNLTKAARILIEGMNGTIPFWYTSSGEQTITECANANSTSPGNLTSGECYITDGEDIIIWTYHFTIFGTYTIQPVITVTTIPSSGGSGSSMTCDTEWSCTEWNYCEEGTQTRVCSYPKNFCEPVLDKPIEVQSCIVEQNEVEENTIETPTFFQSLFTGLVTGTISTFRNPIVSWIVPSVTLVLAVIALIYISKKNKTNKKSKKKSKNKNKKNKEKKDKK